MDRRKRESLKQAISHIERAIILSEIVLDKESDCIDNYPENLQGTETFEKMENAVDCLNDALESLEEAKEKIEEAM